ncbi:MAG: RHS repeat-associated core domain-containing protein [Phycisphaerales bacterium]
MNPSPYANTSGSFSQLGGATILHSACGPRSRRGGLVIRLAIIAMAFFAMPAFAWQTCEANDNLCPDEEGFDWSAYCGGGSCGLDDLYDKLEDCYCAAPESEGCILPPSVWQAAIARLNAECDGCDRNHPSYCVPSVDKCEAAAEYIASYDRRHSPDLTDEEKCFIYASFGCMERANCDVVGPGDGYPPWDPIIPPGSTYSYPWVFNDLHGLGDPYGDTPHAAGGINLATGIYTGTEIDLSLPAPGFSWRIGRCTIPNTPNGSGNYVDATETVQGFNWRQLSMPTLQIGNDPRFGNELLLIDFHTEGKLLFAQIGATSDLYLPVGDFHGAVRKKTLSGVTLYEFTDQRGTVSEFFAPSGPTPGYLWRITDAHGNSAWRHHPSDPSATGIGADKVADAAGRIYEYEYGTIGTSTRLLRVIVKTKTGGLWHDNTASGVTEIARVTYDYYTTTQSNAGVAGDLKTVTVSRKLSDSSLSDDRVRYYRYLTSGSSPALVHTLWLIVGEEGTRAYDWLDSTFDGDYTGASDSALEPYAEKVLSYISVSDPRVDEYFMNGNCGCGGGSSDEKYTLTYNDNATTYTDTPYSYDSEWKSRTIIEQPDGTFVTLYFDELYKMLAKVVTDADPSTTSPAPKVWATRYFRNDSGRTEKECTPANVTSYTHNPSPLTISNIVPCSTTTGLVRVFDYYAGASMDELLHTARWQEGTAASSANSFYEVTRYFFEREYQVGVESGTHMGDELVYTIPRPFLFSDWSYTVADDVKSDDTAATGSYETLTEYEFYEETDPELIGYILPKVITVTPPIVDAAHNGSGAATPSSRHLLEDGRTDFVKSANGRISYTKYDTVTGLPSVSVADADTSRTASGQVFNGVTIETGFSSSGGGTPLHYVTRYDYDALGRPTTSTLPSLRVTENYYTRLEDRRTVVVSSPRKTSTPTWYGPVSYSVANHAGRSEFSGLIAVADAGTTSALSTWISAEEFNPIAAVSTTAFADSTPLRRMSITKYDKAGVRATESRAYFTVPSAANIDVTTNFDATTYAYDTMGRRIRVKDPTATITRTTFDALGRATESWIGTNDHDFDQGESSGTDNMTKVSVTVFDSGNDKGNSYLTSRNADPDGDWTGTTSDQRITIYTNDVRGRPVILTNPDKPHVLNLFDNLGRVIARGLYSSTGSLSLDSDPNEVGGARLDLTQTFYDERGRVWKTITHKIDASDGSKLDTLASLTWYDPEGRTIKSSSPGGLSKTQYDRLGRTTHQWVLAKTDDTNYAGVWDDSNKKTLVGGDHVLEESQSVYDNTETGGNGGQTGNLVMTATISRAHTDLADGSTGALDSNADGDAMKFTSTNITGRIQISATWYDALDRASSSCEYGANSTSANAATFDRAAATSPPTSAVNTPVTSYSYGDDGQLWQVTDPRGKKTATLYDALGRVRAEISNFVDGAWSSGSPGEDNIVRHIYEHGLLSKLWVDIDGDEDQDATDQITTYTYGVTKGTTAGTSRLASNALLKEVKYPDFSSSTDVVTHAYNTLAQEIWKKDQAGNILQTDYDLLGRITQRRGTTIVSPYVYSVARIGLAYTDRGQVDTVTQYDNATVGSGTASDQVKYSYDDWGNVNAFTQDVNSAIGAGGNDEYVTAFTYAKATPTGGHDTIRRTYQKVKYTTTDKQSLEYQYLSTGNSLDDVSSRVSRVHDGTRSIAEYKYLGSSQLVSTSLPEAGVSNDRFGATAAGYYQRLDPLNRIEHDVWTKGRNLYEVDVAYDESGNIIRQEDKLHRNWGGSGDPGVYDAAYTMDDRNRLVRTTEGNWNGSAISSVARREVWSNTGATADALSQTGNWDRYRLDLNGDGDFTDTGDLDDSRTYNTVNELLTRDTDSTSGTTGNNYSTAYDEVGNLTDDGKDYLYVYDVFGRLKSIKKRSNSAVVAEYEYNGLDMRTGWHYDADGDSEVDGSDPWYRFVYDEKWRIVATFRGSDTSPKELFAYHNAGMNGRGGSSYIDSVILRNKDANTAWTSSSDGTCEERIYYVQNWRADVSAVLSDAGEVREWIKYSSYGVPSRIDPGDYNRDGFVNGTDYDDFADDFDNVLASADVNFDGFVNGDDYDLFADAWENPSAAGRNVLSAPSIGNRIGYAGYQHELAVAGVDRTSYHIRYRVYDAGLGAWTRRDPIEYLDGTNLYAYVNAMPVTLSDSSGLQLSPAALPAWLEALVADLMAAGLTPAQIAVILRNIGIAAPLIAHLLDVPLTQVDSWIHRVRQGRDCDALHESYKEVCSNAFTCTKNMNCAELQQNYIGHLTCIMLRRRFLRNCVDLRAKDRFLDHTDFAQQFSDRSRAMGTCHSFAVSRHCPWARKRSPNSDIPTDLPTGPDMILVEIAPSGHSASAGCGSTCESGSGTAAQ